MECRKHKECEECREYWGSHAVEVVALCPARSRPCPRGSPDRLLSRGVLHFYVLDCSILSRNRCVQCRCVLVSHISPTSVVSTPSPGVLHSGVRTVRPEELPVSECHGSRSINFDLIMVVSLVLHHNSTFVPCGWFIDSLILYKNRLTNLEWLLCLCVLSQLGPTARRLCQGLLETPECEAPVSLCPYLTRS